MSSNSQYVLVTGANGGLGLGLCLRLIDDFLSSRPPSDSLTLLFTTRSPRKSNEVLTAIKRHIQKRALSLEKRIHLQPENVDLTDLLSVRSLARKLNESNIPKLDAVILNAGIAGWSGLDWPKAVGTILLNYTSATTWPEFKLGVAGMITNKQFSPIPNPSSPAAVVELEEPPLGQIFCANVFGHYMLTHWLMPLLQACEKIRPGKIIWISSIEPQGRNLDEEDIQALTSNSAYESTKRLVDVLALTYDNPCTAPFVSSFTTHSSTTPLARSRTTQSTPTMHVAQPGVLTTTIIALYWIVHQAYYLAIWFARIIGSPWATLDAYPAAISACWLAFTPQAEIAKQEQQFGVGGGRVKWGSAVTRWGTPSVKPTEVDWWGINGSGTDYMGNWWAGGYGRAPGAKTASKEDTEELVALGQRMWQAMEKLRIEWEGRIQEYDKLEAAVRT